MDDRNTRRVPPTPPVDEPRVEPSGGEGLGSLVTGIVEDLQNIVRGEVQLAKIELKEDASKIGKAVATLAAGGILALVGFNFLMWTAIFLLDEWIEEIWISAAIVAATLLVIGGIIAMAGKSQLSKANLKPEDTIESLKEDKEWASRQVKSVKK